MKKTKILAGFLLASSLHACSWFGDPSPSLPPETQTGANTFGCLINGKVFQAKGGGGYETITKDYNGGLMIIGNYVTNGMLKQTAIALSSLQGIGYYKHTASRSLFYADEKTKCSVGFNEIPVRGGVKITKFERGEDKINNLKWLIISGTFDGVLPPNASCKDTTYITQGRFDVKFQ